MPADDFVPALNPSVGARNPITFRTRETSFGDGYLQRSADGINNIDRVWELSWELLTQSQAADIRAFLESKGGWQSFTYTIPGDVQRRYRCKTFTPAILVADLYSMTATFEMVNA